MRNRRVMLGVAGRHRSTRLDSPVEAQWCNAPTSQRRNNHSPGSVDEMLTNNRILAGYIAY